MWTSFLLTGALTSLTAPMFLASVAGARGSVRLHHRGAIPSITDLHQQAFLAHPGEIASQNAGSRQVGRSYLTSLERQGDGPFPERWLRSTGNA